MSIKKEEFGMTSKGEKVTKYTMENKNGMKVSLLDLGAVISNIFVKDKNGKLDDVALGYDKVENYEVNPPAFGATVGRYANRISEGKFELNGKTYSLEQNDSTNCLHGGTNRFEHHMYTAECTEGLEEDSIAFTRVSPDMEQGFPGNLTLTVTFTLNDANELMISYYAVSDMDTIINLTNHCYFNIGTKGHQTENVLGQQLQIFSENYTPIGEKMLPTGEIRSVENTAFDFRKPHLIGERIGKKAADDSTVTGYDHNYVLNHKDGEVDKVVRYADKESGRVMEVYTDFPGLQVYTAETLYDENGKNDTTYGNYGAICFETQNYPNAVNTKNFPNAILRAGEEYERMAVYRFDVEE